MPPYAPVTSKAQSRLLFAKAHRGELSLDDAKGKTEAADFPSLPERKAARVTRRGRAPKRSPRVPGR